MSQYTSSGSPADNATPVKRLAMEVTRVYRDILYTDRCGESGRVGINDRLEVDAAAVLFPVAEAGRFRAGRPAELARSHGCGCRRRRWWSAGCRRDRVAGGWHCCVRR